MKKNTLLFLGLFLWASTSLTAQCNWEVNDTDPMTDQKTLVTKKLCEVSSKEKLDGKFQYLTFRSATRGGILLAENTLRLATPLPEGTAAVGKMDIRFSDGEIITIETGSAGNIQVTKGYTLVDLPLVLSDAPLQRMAGLDIKAVQLHFHTFKVQFVPTAKEVESIRAGFACLAEALKDQP